MASNNTPLRKQITEQIFTVADFFSSEECDAYIEVTEKAGYRDAPITTSRGPQMRPEIRNNTRVMIDDLARADELYKRVELYVPKTLEDCWSVCGLNERFRFYRYDVGQQFNWHYDGCFERDNGERSFLTFMVYLNDGFAGGETQFSHVDIEPQRGMALFFIHQIKHKGQSVSAGRKYVLRSDVMYQYVRPAVQNESVQA